MKTEPTSSEFVEMIKGLVLPFIFSVAAAFYWGYYMAPSDLKTIPVTEAFGAISSVAGTLAGFLFTAIAVLTSVKESPLLNRMTKTGHYRVMVRDTFLTCAVLVLALLLSVALIFMNETANRPWVVAVVFLFSFGITLTLEIGRRFWLVVKYL